MSGRAFLWALVAWLVFSGVAAVFYVGSVLLAVLEWSAEIWKKWRGERGGRR